MAESRILVKKVNLSCQICHKVLQKPTTVPCGHSFCMLCIHQVWDCSVCLFSCPECNHLIKLKPPLIENTILAAMVKDIEASGHKPSTKRSNLSGPQTVPGGATSVKRTKADWPRVDELCLEHKCPLVIYCCNDKQLLCAQCALFGHEGHKTELVSEAFKKKEEHLNDANKKSKQTFQKQETEVKKLNNNIKQFEQMARGTEDKCEVIFVKLINSLQRHRGTVRELIEAQGRAAVAQAQSSLEKLELGMEKQRRRVMKLDQLAQMEDSVQFLQRLSSLLHSEEDDCSNLTMDPHLVFTPINEAVEEFEKRVENNIEMEINTLSQTLNSHKTPPTLSSEHTVTLQPNPDCSSQTESNQPEPKTRSEFLQYACELTLDSNTAHKDLVLSDRDRKVRVCPCKQNAPRNQDRFVHRRQVLCIEGLQADHCYYEVMVCGGKAEIALAYKGIDRKSHAQASAFGGNDKSWSLDRSKTYSVCHKDKGVLLTATPRQDRIGVYLKFKEGTISFYEVSETMTFLYSVKSLFTEALYPGFWLDEKCHIKLCDLRQDTELYVQVETSG